jgi:GMP reductase
MNKFFDDQIKLDFKDVLIVPINTDVNSRSLVNLERTFNFRYYKKKLTCIPIIVSNMTSTGTISMAKEISKYKCLTVLHKFNSIENINKLEKDVFNYTFISCGINENDIKYAEKILTETKIDKLCIDVANGYLNKVNTIIKHFRNNYPHILIMVGNVVTQDRCNELFIDGADIIKIGIGSGSCCLTRNKTGVGYPQLSCILDCTNDNKNLGYIVSDGGCSTPSDICKAFGAGVDFVMLGGMLGGHDECEGEIVEINGKKKMLIYGMSSETAQNKYNGGMENYRTSEGRSFYIDYKGCIKNTLNDILGGLRSYGTYIGCNDIKNFGYNTQFVKVNRQLNNPYDN